MVFFVTVQNSVQNLVAIDAVVSKICKFEFFARSAGKLFVPTKSGFWGNLTSELDSNINKTPKTSLREFALFEL